MLRNKTQNMRTGKTQNYNLKFKILSFTFLLSTLFLILSSLSSAQEQFVYDDKGKRNPFIPLVTSDGRILNLDQETDSEIHLEGIMYDERGFSYAIVNQAIVQIGDWVGNYQVYRIEKNKVIFLKEGKPLEVELKKEEK